jgi:hypothetical protein
MIRKMTIFSSSFIKKQIRDGATLTHFNSVIKQETRFNLSLKPNMEHVRCNLKKIGRLRPDLRRSETKHMLGDSEGLEEIEGEIN